MSNYVPCPACGGQVHRIAGTCKHCKADLVELREQAARAARAPSQGGLRQTFKSTAPPPPAAEQTPAPQRVTTSGTSGGSQPVSLQNRPVVYAEPSGWARRWPLAVSAIAVAAIIVSLVILLQSGDDDDGGQILEQTNTNTPRMVPDNMPDQSPGGPLGSAPNAPIPDPRGPAPDPGAPAPKAWTTAPDAGMFAVALTETVCAKFEDCGFADQMTQDMCREISKGLSSPDIDDMVQSGTCTYDRHAASACLEAIDAMTCPFGTSGKQPDLGSMLGQASGLLDCTRALDCR